MYVCIHVCIYVCMYDLGPIENGEGTARTDEEKVNLILKTVGHGNVTTAYVGRLGTAAPNRTRRPLKVVLGNGRQRNSVVGDARKLKNAGPSNSKQSVILGFATAYRMLKDSP